MSEASFEPGRLRLARELRGQSQSELARVSGVSAAAISQFESGATRPSAARLAELARSLDTPVTFFGRPLSETHEGFFRSLRRTKIGDRRKARAIAHVVHDLGAQRLSRFPEVDVPIHPVPDLDPNSDWPAEAARHVRKEWRLPQGPIRDVVELLEQHGVLVLRTPLASVDVDAFSLPFPDRPVVVLGTDKNDRARSRFDAAHELGHLVLHGEQIWGMNEVERQAHTFAAEFLMPREMIRKYLPERADWPTLFTLKQQWQVSLAALLMRAKTLGVMSPEEYLNAVKFASARGWRRVEPVPLGPPESPTKTHRMLASGKEDLTVAKWFPAGVLDPIVDATA
jgi:Zn-dependent peptidase ImmA (M78 family)/DNA-binding XRE family transcriptional regulator